MLVDCVDGFPPSREWQIWSESVMENSVWVLDTFFSPFYCEKNTRTDGWMFKDCVGGMCW